MVGLVVVSHSAKMAKSLVELVKKITPTEIPVAAAGGVNNDPDILGTDANMIKEAIESVYSDDGVIVLMDMGSAILSAELALDFFDEKRARNIMICSAPIVEGAISAAAQISINSSLEKVINEAMEGLSAKQEHLKKDHDRVSNFNDVLIPSCMENCIKKVFTIKNAHGLHARPAARFVQVAGSFKNTKVEVSNITRTKGPVSAGSLNKIATLGVSQNDQILIAASGEDAANVIKALEELIEGNFGEPLSVQKSEIKRKRADGVIPVSEGIAIGKTYIFSGKEILYEKKSVSNIEEEKKKFQDAVRKVKEEISRNKNNLKNIFTGDDLAIFEAHLVLLQDPELLNETEKLILNEKCNAEYAWDTIIRNNIKVYENLDDAYMQLRGNDLRDIGNQVLEMITGDKLSLRIDADGPVILFANELTPTETATLDLSKVQGIVTKTGGATSHTAILARALGIPAICGYMNIDNAPHGEDVIIDGFDGKIYINPNDNIKTSLIKKKEEWEKKREEQQKAAQGPAITVDGKRLIIMANIGSAEEVSPAIMNGAEGIGLLRTEFMFLDRKDAPSEEEQYQKLLRIISPFEGKPVTVRTLDVGGDKHIPYIQMPVEDNPFLGVRGIRLYQDNMDLFKEHIRAILRAAAEKDLEIMFPMVSQVEEFHDTRKIIEGIHEDLVGEGVVHAWPVRMGVMIETPSAVMMANELAKAVDFFSIGTNDLTQYVMAAERGNPALDLYTDPLHPSVLRSIKTTVDAAHGNNITVSICGEMGGDVVALPVALGLGIDKLSMNSPKIPLVKQTVRKLNYGIMKDNIDNILKSESVSAVRSIAMNLMGISKK